MRFLLALTVAAATDQSFYWLSDLHLDLLYQPNASQSTYCRSPSFDFADFERQWEKRFVLPHLPQTDPEDVNAYEPPLIADDINTADPLLPAFHGRYGCDTPPSLLWASLLSIRESSKKDQPAFVLITGDLSGHYWLPQTKIMRFLTMYAATELLYKSLDLSRQIDRGNGEFEDQLDFLSSLKALPTATSPPLAYNGPQLVVCVGNNDMLQDYRPRVNSTWNQAHYEMWKDAIIPPEERPNFERGQYYSVLVKDSSPALRVACLNSVWWSRQANITPAEVDDPAAQFEWLENLLSQARHSNEQVILAGHIPPIEALYRNVLSGFTLDDQWHKGFSQRYRSLIRKYRDTVRAQLFGHLHTDEFRIQYEEETSEKPYGIVFMAPSICSNHGTNPSWRKVFFETEDCRLLNYSQIYTPLYGHGRNHGTFNKRELLSFTRKYTSLEHFGRGALTPMHMQKALDRRLLDHQGDARRLWSDELVGGNFPPSFLLRCVMQERAGAAACLRALVASSHSDQVSLVSQ